MLGQLSVERLGNLVQLASNGEVEPADLGSGEELFISQLVVESFQQFCFKLVEVDSESLLELILF